MLGSSSGVPRSGLTGASFTTSVVGTTSVASVDELLDPPHAESATTAEIAEKKNFYIFDDATYRPFYLDAPIRSLYSINPERVIHAISFSKILAPGLRTAFVYLPSSLAPVFINNKANLSLNNSGITQALIEFWLKSKIIDRRKIF